MLGFIDGGSATVIGVIFRRKRVYRRKPGSVGFLFLGELFLIPHLLPIAVALARGPRAPQITLFVITSIHAEIIREALARLGLTDVTVRKARLFRNYPPGSRETPRLPHKLLVLAANAFAILRHDVVVVAERTSLWLPAVARFGARFVYNEHGAGPHGNFLAARNRAAACLLMPGTGMADRANTGGGRVRAIGYVKRDYARIANGCGAMPCFAEQRPVVVYVPHWLACKSSWWTMGDQVLDYFVASDRYNLILAPHIRLPRIDPDFAARAARYAGHPNIHVDTGSFSLVDQRYIAGADIYLGDGSSQAVEFAERSRPIIFLNGGAIDWAADPRFSHWAMGQVVGDIAGLDAALANAHAAQPRFCEIQSAYVATMMGEDDGLASTRAAAAVHEVMAGRRKRAMATAH